MKKLYFIITIAICSVANAQTTYHPMLESANKWSFAFEFFGVENPCVYPFDAMERSLFTTGDVVINSVTYKTLESPNCTFGFIREDTAARKVWFKENNSNPERLIYDFSMQVGDSIELLWYNNNPPGPGWYWQNGFYTLNSIDSVNTASGYRRQFHLNCNCANSNELTWVEGIGNLANPIYTHCNNGTGIMMFASYCPDFPHSKGGDFVICFEHAQKVYFDSCGYSAASFSGQLGFEVVDSCDFYFATGGINEIDNPFSVSISPNPFNSKTEVRINNYSFSKIDFTLYNDLGKIVRSNSFKSSYTILDRSDLPAGIYFYRFREGDRSATGKLIID